MAEQTTTPESILARSADAPIVSEAERERIREMLGDEIADNWEYYKEQADKTDAEMEAAYEANRDAMEAEERERDAVVAQAQVKLDAALACARMKYPDMSGLGTMKTEVVELVATVCVGPGHLIANPYFIMANDPSVIAVILMHEWLHVRNDHGRRGVAFRKTFAKDDDMRTCDTVWNAGGDLEVNSELLAELISVGLQHEGLVPGYGDYTDWPAGLTAEEYAARIMACPERMAHMQEIGKHRLTRFLSDE